MAEHTPKCATLNREETWVQRECDCDGYHTFAELYEHRFALFLALCKWIVSETETHWHKPVWRSKLHYDRTNYDGWFIMGMGRKPGEQITYHLPLSKWGETDFAETLPRAPEWDGHTSDDVLDRLKRL